MKSTIFLFSKGLLGSLLFLTLMACDKEDAGPSCSFNGGINVGYKVRYMQGNVGAGGTDVCEYATASLINLNYYDYEVKADSGLKIELKTDINPNFSGCPQNWLRFHTNEDVVIGKTYECMAWVLFEMCNSSNAKGWIKFSVFDTEKQSVSGTFEITEYFGPNQSYNLISQGGFKNVPLATFNL